MSASSWSGWSERPAQRHLLPTMADLILHHYPMSPFAEKARLMLGLKGLAWRSVHIPSVMPKPDLLALTGGYRRTPVLQIGGDIWCDTALIADVLEQRQPTPPLYPAAHRGLARIVAQWADHSLFWAAMGWSLSGPGLADLFAGQPPEAAQAFGADRAAMGPGAPRLRPGDAQAALRSYLRRLSAELEHQPFLMGDQPGLADLAAYHPLWFCRTQTPSQAGVLDATPAVRAWMDRVAAIGHGQPQPMSAEAALDAARAAGPAPLPEQPFIDLHGLAPGSQVSVAAESFGTEPTTGELVAATRLHVTLRRTDPRAGTVHVHFPRIGYVLKKASS